MDCRDIQEKLSAYIEGAVSPEDKALVDLHLLSCKTCNDFLNDLKKTIEYVKDLEEVQPPPWLTQKIMARVRAESKPKKSFLHRLFYPLHVKLPLEIAATIAVAITTIYIFKTIQPEIRMPSTSEVVTPQTVLKERVKEDVIPETEKREDTEKRPKKPAIQKDEVASPAEQPSSAKEPETTGKKETYKIPELIVMNDKALPSTGAAVKEEAKGRAMPAVPKLRAMEAKKKEGINLTINVKDIEATEREIKRIVPELGGVIVKAETFENKTLISVNLASDKIKELTEKLTALGRMKESRTYDRPEGESEVNIEILRHADEQ